MAPSLQQPGFRRGGLTRSPSQSTKQSRPPCQRAASARPVPPAQLPCAEPFSWAALKQGVSSSAGCSRPPRAVPQAGLWLGGGRSAGQCQGKACALQHPAKGFPLLHGSHLSCCGQGRGQQGMSPRCHGEGEMGTGDEQPLLSGRSMGPKGAGACSGFSLEEGSLLENTWNLLGLEYGVKVLPPAGS